VITGARETAVEVLLEMATSFTVPLEVYPGVGDQALYCRRFDSIVLARRGVVIRLLNDVVNPASIIESARQLDSLLQALEM
jgi:hypothetical protein